MHKMLTLGFLNFRSITHLSTLYSVATLVLYLCYFVDISIFNITKLRDKSISRAFRNVNQIFPSPLINSFFKLVELECLIHHWYQALMIPSFTQYTQRLKIGIFECCSHFECCSGSTAQFFPFHEKIEHWNFLVLA